MQLAQVIYCFIIACSSALAATCGRDEGWLPFIASECPQIFTNLERFKQDILEQPRTFYNILSQGWPTDLPLERLPKYGGSNSCHFIIQPKTPEVFHRLEWDQSTWADIIDGMWDIQRSCADEGGGKAYVGLHGRIVVRLIGISSADENKLKAGIIKFDDDDNEHIGRVASF